MKLYDVTRIFLSLFFNAFCKIKYIDKDFIPEKGSFIIASNHLSYYDPFVSAPLIKRNIRYLAKEELFKESFGFLIKALGAFPIKRGSGDLGALKQAIKILKEDGVLGIFPEGSRSEDGNINEGMHGAAQLAVMSGVPIIPFAIVGTQNCLIRKFPPKWQRIIVRYGAPIRPENFEGPKKERIEKITNETMNSIRKMKKEIDEIWEP